jgi:hypothetical protein
MPNDDFHRMLDAVTRIQRLSDEHWHVLDASCRAPLPRERLAVEQDQRGDGAFCHEGRRP